MEKFVYLNKRTGKFADDTLTDVDSLEDAKVFTHKFSQSGYIPVEVEEVDQFSHYEIDPEGDAYALMNEDGTWYRDGMLQGATFEEAHIFYSKPEIIRSGWKVFSVKAVYTKGHIQIKC